MMHNACSLLRMRRNEHALCVVVQQNSSDNATAERLDISFCASSSPKATLQFHVVSFL